MRERVAVPASRIPKALGDLAAREHLAEVVLLSTCNRTEVYARATRFHAAVSDVLAFLSEQAQTAPEALGDHLYTFYDDAAVAHLFAVAAGLDSMILGEGEILGQVRDAWEQAEAEGVTGPALRRLFRHAIEAGKRARHRTGIGRGAHSVSSAAVALAQRTMFSLRGRTVLVLGAGDVAAGLARALQAAGAGEVLVANRTYQRAADLAARVGGRAVALAELPEVLAVTDVLLTATDSTEVHVARDDLEAVMARRDHAPLLVVDVAVPRDVDPGAAEVPGITLLDMDDLEAFTEQTLDERRREAVRAQEVLAAELERYRQERTAHGVTPLVRELRARAEAIRAAEVDRFCARSGRGDGREELDALTRAIVNKLLHTPTVRLREAAGSREGEALGDALAALFDLRLPDEGT
jgi:glutamyl-tRNA reductase